MSPTLLLLTALVQAPTTEKQDAGALGRSLVETTKAAVEVLNGVKDRASADQAKPRLEELNARIENLEKQYAARPRGERIKAELSLMDERKKQAEALALAHDRVFARHKDAYKVLAGTGLFRRVEGCAGGRGTAPSPEHPEGGPGILHQDRRRVPPRVEGAGRQGSEHRHPAAFVGR